MSKELKIGAFVVTVLVASFFLINYLRGEDIFNREMEVKSRYETVEGLVASAPVYIKGYKAGKVSEVTYDPETEDFMVTCSVSRDFRIPSDSKMIIYSIDIMGSKGIRIDFGSSDTAAQDGDMLAPAFEAGMMDSLAEGITPILEKVNSTMDSLAVTVSGVNRMLSEENQKNLSSTLAHLDRTMSNLNALSESVQGKSREIESVIDNMSVLSAKLGDIASQVDTTLVGVNRFVDTVNASDIEGLLASVRNLLENVNDPDGTIGQLINNDSIYNSVDTLLADIDELVRKIQENPKKYIKISVF